MPVKRFKFQRMQQNSIDAAILFKAKKIFLVGITLNTNLLLFFFTKL